MFISRLLFVVLLFQFTGLKSQLSPDSTNFRAPLEIPLVLAGNFCELRPNHFHTGLDIKTKGVVGQKVVSIEEGYVSRIFYSHYGYGLAIYVTHPNGYTSLYAHLSKFNPTILKKVRAIQQENESETFDVLLDSGEISLNKGQQIGLSGTSGSSYAPHLHFEIRDTKKGVAVNPLKFGFKIKDNIKPDIKGIKVYPLNDSSHVNGTNRAQYISTIKINGAYQLTKPIKANGAIGFGIHTTDRLNAAGNICGVYSIDLSVDNAKIYNHTMDHMDFDKNRYINHHMDYVEFTVKKRNIHKNYLLGNNKLSIYHDVVNNGILNIKNDSLYKVGYNVVDAYGNESKLKFKVSGVGALAERLTTTCKKEFIYNEVNYFDTTNFTLLMGEGAIYKNHCLVYKYEADSNQLAGFHVINNKQTPIHQYVDLAIGLNKSVDSSLEDKLLIVEQNEKGYLLAHGGTFLNGRVHTKVRAYGKYSIRMDNTKPVIRMLTKQSMLTRLKSNSTIKFKITDNLSGIKTYKAFIDEKWVLSNYNRKRASLAVRLQNSKISKGKHQLKIMVIDERGNEQVLLKDINVL